MSANSDRPVPPRLEPSSPPGAARPAAEAPAGGAPAIAMAAALRWQGSLARESLLRLLYSVAATQASGRLELATERGRFTVHARRGVVEHAASDAEEDALGPYLVARGVVGRDALGAAERRRGEFGGDLVTALASLGFVNPAASFRVLQEHALAVLGRAAGADRGASSWDPSAAPPPSSFPLGSRWSVVCDVARRLDGLAVRRLLGDRIGRVASRAGGRVDPTELRLNAVEARAAALFDGRHAPAELVASRPAEADVILRVALLLAETELLAFGERAASPAAPAPVGGAAAPVSGSARPPARAAAPPPASEGRAASAPGPGVPPPAARVAPPPPTPGPRPPPAGATPRPVARPGAAARPPSAAGAPAATAGASGPPAGPADVGALAAIRDRLRTADHFQALGVGRDASASQIKAAYFQLAKTYHPDAAPRGEPAEAAKLRVDIFARLGEAWRVLGDEAQRDAYLRQLASGAAEVDVSGILKAEELFQKAVVFVRTKQYARAREALDEAARLHPDEAEFEVWRAWVEFLLAEDKKRQQPASAAAIEAALGRSPMCAPGYLFLGRMAKLCGDLPGAERHLRRGLAVDPKHVELANELKFLRK